MRGVRWGEMLVLTLQYMLFCVFVTFYVQHLSHSSWQHMIAICNGTKMHFSFGVLHFTIGLLCRLL